MTTTKQFELRPELEKVLAEVEKSRVNTTLDRDLAAQLAVAVGETNPAWSSADQADEALRVVGISTSTKEMPAYYAFALRVASAARTARTSGSTPLKASAADSVTTGTYTRRDGEMPAYIPGQYDNRD